MTTMYAQNSVYRTETHFGVGDYNGVQCGGDACQVDDMPATVTHEATEFRPINTEERMVLDVWQSRIVDLAEELGVEERDVPRILDRIAARWLEVDGEFDSPRVLLALGSAFGELLVERHGFRWTRYKEEGLYAWAVVHDRTEVTVWPFAFAAQRLMDTDVAAFLEMIYFCILDEVDELEERVQMSHVDARKRSSRKVAV